MSKSLNNAIFLSDTPKQVKKKINAIYPGQSRDPDQPGDPDINPVFDYCDAFIKDKASIDDLRDRYRKGDNLGDGHVKAHVIEAINELLDPIREKRAALEGPAGDARVLEIIKDGARRANAVTEQTLALAKEKMGFDFANRELTLR